MLPSVVNVIKSCGRYRDPWTVSSAVDVIKRCERYQTFVTLSNVCDFSNVCDVFKRLGRYQALGWVSWDLPVSSKLQTNNC